MWSTRILWILITAPLFCAASSLQAADCNGNGTVDRQDIASGDSQDCNSNNIPDECELAPLPLASSETVSLAAAAQGLATGDLDGDGLADLAVSSENSVRILLNRSTDPALPLRFEEVNYSAAGTTRELATGDLDGDGDLDVVFLSEDEVGLLYNIGGGVFGDPVLLGLPLAWRVELADLNGDGASDLAVANRVLGARLSVFLSLGDGTFETPVHFEFGSGLRAISSGDADDDGDVDVLAVADFSVHLLRNDGEGNLAAPSEIFDQAWRPENVVFSDMDGDGEEDILVMDEDRAAFAGNAGGGRFGQLAYFLREESLPGFAPGVFFPVDIDGSGGRDMVIAHADSSRFSVLLGGDEPFATSAIFDPGFISSDLIAADLDGDGDMDLVLSRTDEPSLTVLRNDRTTRLTSLGPPGPLVLTQDTIDLDNWEPHSSALGDFDGDGDLDVAAIDGEDRVIIVENQGDGTFTPGPVFRLDDAREMISLTAADFDDDGDLDLAMVAESSRNLLLLLNDGDLEFSEREGRELPERPFFVTTADLNGDGRPEIISVNEGAGRISVLDNRGDGAFASRRDFRVGDRPQGAASGDFDGDGDTDLAVACRGSAELSLLWNDGDGDFPRREDLDAGQINSLAAVDLDGDGDLDLVASSAGRQGRVLQFSNDGDGDFSLRSTTDLGQAPHSLITVDLNGDGFGDIVTANPNRGTLSVLLNQGGVLSDPVHHNVGRDPRFALGGDLDGDGDHDLISANHTSHDLTVLLNQSAPAAFNADHLFEICTEADFYRVGIPTPRQPGAGDTFVEWSTKYVVPLDVANPEFLRPVFQNVRRHPLHREFLADVFPDFFPALSPQTYDRLTGRRVTRRYFTGAIFLLGTPAGSVYGFNVLASFDDDPGELPTLSEVRGVFLTLSTVFSAGELVYFPDTRLAREDAEGWADPPFPVFLGDLAPEASFQAYTRGVGFGRVRVLDREGFDDLNSSGQISFQDILVLDHAPRDIEGVVSGVITAETQVALSHLAVRTARRGTPNAFVADATERFAELDGRLIRLEVSSGGVTTEEVTLAEAREGWDANRPELVDTPGLDAVYAGLDSLGEMDLSGDTVAPESRYGGKATNMARLQRILDGEFERYRESGFSIPMHYYLDFMRTNTIASARNPGRSVTYERFVEELTDWPEFQGDSRLRFDTLESFRDHIEDDSRIDAGLVEVLALRAFEVFGENRARVRCRSSSNVEDILEFNGAGLYDSTSACAADDVDNDERGPSLCDATRDSERGFPRALRRVWGSLWNFRAYEERAYYGLPQEQAAMGIFVSRAYVDERANGVAFTGNPARAEDRRFLVTAQLGEESVVDPEPGVSVEKSLLEMSSEGLVELVRAEASSLVEEGEQVLSDERLAELGAVLWHIDRRFPIEDGGRGRENVLLDVEFKIESDGALAIKQVRPFLRSEPAPPAPVFELVIPAGTSACGVFVQSRPLDRAYELKSALRFAPGRLALPTGRGDFSAELFEEVRLGPAREVAVPLGPGAFRVTRMPEGDLATYRFRYEQDFILPGGEEYRIQLSDLAFEARGAEPVEAVRVIDEEYLTHGIVLNGNIGFVVTYSSCTYETLPLWEVNVEIDDGAIRLLERHEPPPTPNDTGPAALVLAELELPGMSREITGYWDLVYSALRHNRSPRYWTRLNPPVDLEGVDGPVHFIEVVAPEARFEVEAQVRYLDADYGELASPRVRSYRREGVGTPFRRADVYDDGLITLTDAVFILQYLFRAGAVPSCLQAGDVNRDGGVNLSDAVAILSYLFLAGEPPRDPFIECGLDAAERELSCESYDGCG